MYASTGAAYGIPPPGYMPQYTSPKYASYSTPTKGHTRRASHEPSGYYQSTAPPPAYYNTYTQPQATAQDYYYGSKYNTPSKTQPEFVSATYERSSRKPTRSADAPSHEQYYTSSTKRPSTKHHAHSYPSSKYHDVFVDDEKVPYYYGNVSPQGSPPPPYNHPNAAGGHWTTTYEYGDYQQQQQHHQSSGKTSSKSQYPRDAEPPVYRDMRPRAATYSTPSKPTVEKSTPRPKSKRTSSAKTPPAKATEKDRAAANIPVGYSIKNWDPAEEPIFLLGSVFDANSLGKWIYDWTVFHHGPATPMADLAGDLWLLLIQLAGKVKRAEECLDRVRRRADRDVIDDFLESGERLWLRLGKILQACEEFMWREAKKENGGKGGVVAMGPRSGCEFVDSIFGRSRKLLDTEKLMTGVRLWSHRFDANCEEILRHPSG